MRIPFSLLLTGSFLLAALNSRGAPPLGRDAAKLFADACSACHGADLEGGKGVASSVANGDTGAIGRICSTAFERDIRNMACPPLAKPSTTPKPTP